MGNQLTVTEPTRTMSGSSISSWLTHLRWACCAGKRVRDRRKAGESGRERAVYRRSIFHVRVFPSNTSNRESSKECSSSAKRGCSVTLSRMWCSVCIHNEAVTFRANSEKICFNSSREVIHQQNLDYTTLTATDSFQTLSVESVGYQLSLDIVFMRFRVRVMMFRGVSFEFAC